MKQKPWTTEQWRDAMIRAMVAGELLHNNSDAATSLRLSVLSGGRYSLKYCQRSIYRMCKTGKLCITMNMAGMPVAWRWEEYVHAVEHFRLIKTDLRKRGKYGRS